MTPGARLQAAIEVLEQAFAAPLPADAILEAYFRRRRYAGGGDRRAVRARVFAALRRKARLEWNLEKIGLSPSPRAGESPRASSNNAPLSGRLLVLADAIVGDGVNAEEAAGLFASSAHAPQALSDDERRAALALAGCPLDDPAMPDWARLEYPAWLDGSLRAVFAENLSVEIAALNAPAPLDLRVNALKGTREGARAALAAEGIDSVPTPLSPWGLRVEGPARITQSSAFKQGLVEVQDEGSQIVAALVGARLGLTVVDYCAGAGGKTLALAACMAEKSRIVGRLVACDASAERLGRAAERFARAGAGGIERVPLADGADSAPPGLAGAADRVLLDVPCSGSGAWRRDPLAKWRLDSARLAELTASQGRILAAAARLVRPGGRLVYATCSVLCEENETPIASFLDHDNPFRIVPIAEAWRASLGGEVPGNNQFLRLTPASHGTDGYFVAVLEREPSAR
jgi:16S rRNA (cytosine967-C5)-methyltransferase